MSSTTGNVLAKEAYQTPVPVVKKLLEHVAFEWGDLFLEPCRGEGNIWKNVPLPEYKKFYAEITEGMDYLNIKFPKVDVIITNPPFSLTIEFIKKALSELSETGTLIVLQRVNFLGSKVRVPFWGEVGFPDKTPVIVPRPRFSKGSGDSCEYMWMIWDRGDRVKLPQGISHLITD